MFEGIFDDCYSMTSYILVSLLVIVSVAIILALYFTGFFFLAFVCEWALTHFVSIDRTLYWTGAALVALLGLVVSVNKSD